MRLNLDSPILHILSAAWDVLVASILFFITSIPIFTVGAASTAMHATIMSIIDGGCSGVLSKYFSSFKENFKQSTLIWLVFLVALLVLVGDVLACFSYETENMFLAYMVGITVFFIVLYVLMYTYTFAVISRFVVTWKQALRNALYLIGRHPFVSIAEVVVALAHGLSWFLSPFLAILVGPICLAIQEALLNWILNKEEDVFYKKQEKQLEAEA